MSSLPFEKVSFSLKKKKKEDKKRVVTYADGLCRLFHNCTTRAALRWTHSPSLSLNAPLGSFDLPHATQFQKAEPHPSCK